MNTDRKFMIVSSRALVLESAESELETSIRGNMDKGWSICGSLVYVRDGQWHVLLQPMVLEEKRHEIIEH